jgi:hypothetical protein
MTFSTIGFASFALEDAIAALEAIGATTTGAASTSVLVVVVSIGATVAAAFVGATLISLVAVLIFLMFDFDWNKSEQSEGKERSAQGTKKLKKI